MVACPGMARVSVMTSAVIIRVGESCWTLDRAALLAGLGQAEAVPGNSRSGEWQPVRRLSAGSLRVALDDTDPYRDCGQRPAAPRLSDAEAAGWEREFQAACQEIGSRHAAYAPALTTLTTLTPVTATKDGSGARTVARHAFGAVAASVPTGPGGLALLLSPRSFSTGNSAPFSISTISTTQLATASFPRHGEKERAS